MAYQYTPSPWQKTFHNSTARIKVIWAGRRAGKGRAVLTELMRAITLASKSPFLADKDMAKSCRAKSRLRPYPHSGASYPYLGCCPQLCSKQAGMERVEAVHPRVNGGKKEENPGRWQG